MPVQCFFFCGSKRAREGVSFLRFFPSRLSPPPHARKPPLPHHPTSPPNTEILASVAGPVELFEEGEGRKERKGDVREGGRERERGKPLDRFFLLPKLVFFFFGGGGGASRSKDPPSLDPPPTHTHTHTRKKKTPPLHLSRAPSALRTPPRPSSPPSCPPSPRSSPVEDRQTRSLPPRTGARNSRFLTRSRIPGG